MCNHLTFTTLNCFPADPKQHFIAIKEFSSSDPIYPSFFSFHVKQGSTTTEEDLSSLISDLKTQENPSLILLSYASDQFMEQDFVPGVSLSDVTAIMSDLLTGMSGSPFHFWVETLFFTNMFSPLAMTSADLQGVLSDLYAQRVCLGEQTLPTGGNCLWLNTCTSDTTITVTTILFDHPLLNVEAVGPITGVENIYCASTFCQNPTSDPAYVCRIQACAEQTDDFLTAHFSDYISHISDRCHLTYTGPVSAGQVLVDLESCRMIFRDFRIHCSDVSC